MIASNYSGALGALYVSPADFKCSTTICYAIGATKHAQFQAFQEALNVFAPTLKFTAIKVDGAIGANTLAVTRLVAQWMLQNAAQTAGSDPWGTDRDAGQALVRLLASAALTKQTLAAQIDNALPIIKRGAGLLAILRGIVTGVTSVVAPVASVVSQITGGGSSGTTATTTTPGGGTATTQPGLIAPTDKAGAAANADAAAAAADAAAAAAAAAAAGKPPREAGTSWVWYAAGGLAAAAIVGGSYMIMRRRAMSEPTLQPAYGLGRRRPRRFARYTAY